MKLNCCNYHLYQKPQKCWWQDYTYMTKRTEHRLNTETTTNLVAVFSLAAEKTHFRSSTQMHMYHSGVPDRQSTCVAMHILMSSICHRNTLHIAGNGAAYIHISVHICILTAIIRLHIIHIVNRCRLQMSHIIIIILIIALILKTLTLTIFTWQKTRPNIENPAGSNLHICWDFIWPTNDHSSFSHFRDMIGANQNLNGSRKP